MESEVLAKGFEFEGKRAPLIASQASLDAVLAEMPLSDTIVLVVDGVEGRAVSRSSGLTARSRGSSVRPPRAPAYFLGVE